MDLRRKQESGVYPLVHSLGQRPQGQALALLAVRSSAVLVWVPRSPWIPSWLLHRLLHLADHLPQERQRLYPLQLLPLHSRPQVMCETSSDHRESFQSEI